MKNNRRKTLLSLGLIMVLVTSVVVAAGTDIIAKRVDMAVYYNGQRINFEKDQQPLAINNRTYVSARTLADALGKKVIWNPNDPTSVYITSDVNEAQFNQMVIDLNQSKIDIANKNAEIKRLNEKVKELEEELKKKEEKGQDLRDFESKLNRDYRDYKGTRLDIVLKGDSKDIKVDIRIDKNYYKDWEYLTVSEQERLIEDIVYDLQREYKNPKINGFLDGSLKDNSYDFYTNNNDKLVIGGSSGSSSSTITRLEEKIESYYRDDVKSVEIKDEGSSIVAKVSTRYDANKINIDTLRNNIRYDIRDGLNVGSGVKIYVDIYDGYETRLDE